MLAGARDPADRLQDRVEQVRQRFEQARDKADQLIIAAECIFGRSERVHKEPAPEEPVHTEPTHPNLEPPAQPDCDHSVIIIASNPSAIMRPFVQHVCV